MNAIAFDSLESRCLFAAAVTATIANNQLTVTGTDGDDGIYVRFASSDAKGNASLVIFSGDPESGGTAIGTFSTANFGRFVIDAKAGRDYVHLDYEANLNGNKVIPVTIYGGTGDDAIYDERQDNGTATLIDGGAGSDILTGGDTIRGGAGDDSIYGTVLDIEGPGNHISTYGHFDGGDGNDVIGAGGGDTVTGGNGDDAIYGGTRVDAGPGNDRLDIEDNGVFRMGTGDDTVIVHYEASDSDLSDDVYLVGPTDISVYGDDGNDLVLVDDYSNVLLSPKILKAYGGNGNDSLTGGFGQDLLKGEGGNDLIKGGNNSDTLDGGTGNDTLYGDAGNDQLFGSDGNDVLYGGAGNNKLYGQAGADVIHSKNGSVDTLYATAGDNVIDRDPFDVLA